MNKAKFEARNNADYLIFQPQGMSFPIMLPVITNGSRSKLNAWTWNGSLSKPTIRPSVRTKYLNDKGKMVEIHYWLNDGICKCLSDCTDGNADKNLELNCL